MPTLEECISQRRIGRLQVSLTRWDMEQRSIFGHGAVLRWITEVLPRLKTTLPGEDVLSPRSQYEQLVRNYLTGKDFIPPLPHLMNPDKHGIWRFRTENVRIVGWFPRKNVFIVSEIVDKETSLADGFDEASLSKALRVRELLNIDNGAWLNEKLEDLTHVA